MRYQHQQGFSFIEMMVAFAIIGVLGSLTVYAYRQTVLMAEYEGAATQMKAMADLLEKHRLAGKTTSVVTCAWLRTNWPELSSQLSESAPWGQTYNLSNDGGNSVVSVTLPTGHPFPSGYNLMLDGHVSGNVLTVYGATRRSAGDLLPTSEIERTNLYGETVTW